MSQMVLVGKTLVDKIFVKMNIEFEKYLKKDSRDHGETFQRQNCECAPYPTILWDKNLVLKLKSYSKLFSNYFLGPAEVPSEGSLIKGKKKIIIKKCL